jgi:hypothetical protein
MRSHHVRTIHWGFIACTAGSSALFALVAMALLPPGVAKNGIIAALEGPILQGQGTPLPVMPIGTGMAPPPTWTPPALPHSMPTTDPIMTLPQTHVAPSDPERTGDEYREYQQWQYQQFLQLQQQHQETGEPISADQVPPFWEVPAEYFEEVSTVWGSTAPDAPDAVHAPTTFGCFSPNAVWSNDPRQCAPNQLPYIQSLGTLTPLQRSDLAGRLPVELLNTIDAAVPPPQPQNAEEEASVLAIMRAGYIDDGEGGERVAELGQLRETLVAAEQRLVSFMSRDDVDAARPAIESTLLWIDGMKRSAAVSPLTLDEIQAASQELRERLENIGATMHASVQRPTPAPDIHHRIALLMDMLNTDVPQILSEAGLSLPAMEGALLLTVRDNVTALQSSPCWTSDLLCSQTVEILTDITTIIHAVDAVTVDHPYVRNALTERHAELIRSL